MQYKTLINPSFLVLMLDVQEHLKSGWEIDPNNLPANTFVYYEVNLIKDDEVVKGDGAYESAVYQRQPDVEIVDKPPAKKPGRPVQNKAAQ